MLLEAEAGVPTSGASESSSLLESLGQYGQTMHGGRCDRWLSASVSAGAGPVAFASARNCGYVGSYSLHLSDTAISCHRARRIVRRFARSGKGIVRIHGWRCVKNTAYGCTKGSGSIYGSFL